MLKLVSIGVLQLDDRVACLLMHQRGKSQFYCVELDAATALFVSPLYEHSLVLYASETKLSETATKRMGQARCETLFQVHEWQAWQCLLEDNLSSAVLPRRLYALLSRTLFIQSAHAQPAGATDLIRALYAPKATERAFCSSEALLVPYLQTLYAHADSERPKRQPLATAFWQQVESRDEALLQGAINQLCAYEKKASVYPTMREVATLLLNWKLPCARYVAHKIDLMAPIHQLYKATLRTGDTARNLVKSQAFSIFNCALLGGPVTQDATTLVALLWQLMTDETTVEQPVIEAAHFVQYRRLIDWCLAMKGNIGLLLDALYHKQRSLQERCVVVRRRLLVRFLLPMLVAHLEQHVTRTSQQGRSTLECLTVRTIYLAYATLFRASGNKAAMQDADQQQFQLRQEDDARPAVKHLFEFDLVDFNLALSALHQLLSDGTQPWRSQYKWRARIQWDALALKTTLFYVETQPALLELERKINAHYDRHLFETLLSVQLRESPDAAAASGEPLFNENEEEQQYRLVLFDPLELRQDKDLVFMRELALSDLYATALVRESSTNQFFKHRLTNAFLGELEHDQWYQELYFETAQFSAVDRRAVQRRVIIADAHLLTSNDLLGALRWLTFHRATIKQVVFCGSTDLCPLSQNGQPFIDLALRVDPQCVKRRAYDEARRDRIFNDLLDAWHLHQWPCEKDERARFTRHHDWSRTPALYVLQEAEPDAAMQELEDLFYLLQRYQRFTLQLLHRETKPPPLKPRKKSLLRVAPLELDKLMQHHRVTVEDEVFVVQWVDLLRFPRNALTMLLCTLERLVVLGCGEADPRQALLTQVARDKRPTLRYTQSSMK